jgi:hypothetical protein
MVRLYPILFFALFVLAVPVESSGQNGQLAKLSEVHLVVERLSQDVKELGLNRDDIRNHVLVNLRRKLPRLVINESAVAFIDIVANINKVGGEIIKGYFGEVQIQVYRRVIVVESGRFTIAPVWTNSFILTGPPDRAVASVREALVRHLTRFAVDWYRDNP